MFFSFDRFNLHRSTYDTRPCRANSARAGVGLMIDDNFLKYSKIDYAININGCLSSSI
jgi:hypothetical protein